MGMLFAYGLLGASALLMMHQDIREQRISLLGLGLFVLAALLKQVLEADLETLWESLWAAGVMAFITLSCQVLFYLLKREPAMGSGDLLLSPFCGLWLYLSELPCFLLGTGIVALSTGMFWRYRWGMRTFPMTPALLCGLGIVFLMRFCNLT